jgi:hypothetical protein
MPTNHTIRGQAIQIGPDRKTKDPIVPKSMQKDHNSETKKKFGVKN